MFKQLRSPIISIPLSWILIFSFMISVSGCYYFKVTKSTDPPQTVMPEMQDQQKYIVLHAESIPWHFTDIRIDQESVSGIISPIYGRDRPGPVKPEGPNRYRNSKRRDESYLVNEVHVYISDSIKAFSGKISFPLSDVRKIEIYDKAKGATIASWVFSIGGAVMGVIAIIEVIIILTKSSCPFVYSYNGEFYTYSGEMYGGATYPSLERDDYMPLPDIKSLNDKYLIRITNELKEKQFTNVAELLVINHPKNCSVLIDKYGKVQTISTFQKPSSAISSNNIDYTNSVSKKDSSYFLFDETNATGSLNSIILTFDNPNKSGSGKLILSAKNSLWADYAYGKFTELFGTSYNKWNDKQQKVAAKKQLKRILEQDIPLSLFLETDKGWEFVDYYNVVGPLGARDIVLPVDLSKAGAGRIRLKLETGFMFWELDYAGMDFSENIPVQVTALKPEYAIDDHGNDLKNKLSSDDNDYLIQPDIGDEADISFGISDQIIAGNDNEAQTIVLHSKGYYEAIREYKNNPDWKYLYSLRSSHSLSRFSFQEYERFCKDNGIAIASK